MRPVRGVRVALAGGGSGGHLFPGLALSRVLMNRESRPVLYGSRRVGESSWVGEEAERVELASPLLPGRGRDVPGFLVGLGAAIVASLREMRARKPDLVVGLGGYASVGPGIAALLAGRPLMLLEQNAVPGRATRLLAGLGGRVAASFPDSVRSLPARARRRARVVGNPVRSELFAGVRDARRFGLDPARKVLLIMGGSQGAEGLNRRVVASAGKLAERGVQVIHLAGPAMEAEVRAEYAGAGVGAWVAGFTREMGWAYATADLVLARAGGTTIAELAALGKPAVLVPYPYHSDRHQERNGAALVAAGAAVMVREEDLDPERFAREVVDRIVDRSALRGMAEAALGLGVPDAGQRAALFAAEIMSRRCR